jgi:hypothetical protein
MYINMKLRSWAFVVFGLLSLSFFLYSGKI